MRHMNWNHSLFTLTYVQQMPIPEYLQGNHSMSMKIFWIRAIIKIPFACITIVKWNKPKIPQIKKKVINLERNYANRRFSSIFLLLRTQ